MIPIEVDLAQLWKIVEEQSLSIRHRVPSVHGPDHWRRVERYGCRLAKETGADIEVVRLFALFHDSRRFNEDWDPKHGERGAEYAASLRGTALELSDAQFALLEHACIWHASGRTHQDPTIGTCWDADRLDLGRVGIIPSPNYMSTEFGRKVAAYGSIQPFLAGPVHQDQQ